MEPSRWVALEDAPYLLPAFATLFGLLWGSFLNVVIARLPERISLVSPRSRCPSCGSAVASYDNVPLLSYIFLGGRCRSCRVPISIRYPFVEALVGALSLGAFLRHGPSLEYLVELAFTASMVALIFIDYDHQILPLSITYPGIGLGLALAPLRGGFPFFLDALAGVALGAGLLIAVAEAYQKLRKEAGLGYGDVKMLGMIGAFVGWKGVLLTLFLGSLSGSLVGMLLLVTGGGGMKTKLPFGTFLGMGAIATVYAGQPLIGWYSSFF